MTGKPHRHTILILAAGIVSLWTGLPVSAQSARDTPENQLDFSISLGAGYQDNVFHSATDQQGELVGIAGARIAYQEHRPKLEADVRGNFDYRRYSSDSFGGELYSSFNGDVLLLLVPDVFEWKFSDDLAQVYSQDVGPDTPDDREHLNYFTTGPNLHLHLGERTELLLGGAFADTRFSRTKAANSQRVGGSVSLARQLSPLSRISLNAEHSVLMFNDDTANPDVRQDTAYAGFSAQGARTMLSLDAGYSRIDPKGATAPHDGLMLRLVVARQVTSRSTIEIVGGRIFTDSGNLLRLTEQRNGSGSDARLTPSGATTFDSSYGSLIWSTTLNRTAIQLSGEYHKERHADSAFQFDRSRIVTNAQLSRTLTERLTFGIGAHYIYENYDSQDYRGDWIRGVLMLDSRLARTIIARLEYLHDIRHSSIPEFRYTNKQVWLRLNYNPKARR